MRRFRGRLHASNTPQRAIRFHQLELSRLVAIGCLLAIGIDSAGPSSYWNIPIGGMVTTARDTPTGYCEGETVDTTAPGYAATKDAHLKRLRRIEGQVRGVHRMVEQDTYCIDVLTQISAATKALEAVALALLDEHLSHCVTNAIHTGGDTATDKLKEASAAIARLVRS